MDAIEDIAVLEREAEECQLRSPGFFVFEKSSEKSSSR
jgi:hypothetical protein